MLWWNIALTGTFQRISTQVQNSNMKKYILVTASEDNFILEIFLNGCFSNTAPDIFILEILIVTHILHFLLSRCVKEEQIFMDFFLSKCFEEKCKPAELALNFVQNFSFKICLSFFHHFLYKKLGCWLYLHNICGDC